MAVRHIIGFYTMLIKKVLDYLDLYRYTSGTFIEEDIIVNDNIVIHLEGETGICVELYALYNGNAVDSIEVDCLQDENDIRDSIKYFLNCLKEEKELKGEYYV